ncbi:RNase H domain-containing protein [Trichonephila clavipes]|nr:RNase H domain-containing protein [Trichonephila clavipes]
MIQSHVELYGDEMVDKLAKEGCYLPTPSTAVLTYLELYSLKKSQTLAECRVSPTHHWYVGNRARYGHSLQGCDRYSQITLSRFSSGHIKCLSFSANKIIFSICARCQDHQASPEHVEWTSQANISTLIPFLG